MIDDPLALIVQGIFVLAAGMYPVGFLFGVCSDCCCPPCGRCTHLANNGNECPIEGIEWTVDFGGYGPVVVPGVNAGDLTETGIVIPLDDIPDMGPLIPVGETEPTSNGEWLSASLSIIISDIGRPSDECGCESCLYSVGFRLSLEFDNDGFVVLGRTMTATEALGDCSQESMSFTADGPWEVTDSGSNYDDIPESAALGWAGPLGLSASFTIDPCECGACCEDDGSGGAICTDNVAEGSCAGEWLGADTTCEEDGPCPTGSCCNASTGECTQVYGWACNGTWTLGESCDPNPCPRPPEGACCDGEGNCTQTIAANCAGTWSEGVECDPNPCALGSCCAYDADGNYLPDYSLNDKTEQECDMLYGLNADGFYTTPFPNGLGWTLVWTENGDIGDCPPTLP